MRTNVSDISNGSELMRKESERFLDLFDELGDELSEICSGTVIKTFSNEMRDGMFIRAKTFALGCHYQMPLKDSAKFSSLTIAMYDSSMKNGVFLRKRTQIDNQPYELYQDGNKLYWKESNTTRENYYTTEELIHHWRRVFIAILNTSPGFHV